MNPRCSICGAGGDQPHNPDLHRAFEALKRGTNASEPLSPARKAIRDPENFRASADRWLDHLRKP
jgi:hypothetical protein